MQVGQGPRHRVVRRSGKPGGDLGDELPVARRVRRLDGLGQHRLEIGTGADPVRAFDQDAGGPARRPVVQLDDRSDPGEVGEHRGVQGECVDAVGEGRGAVELPGLGGGEGGGGQSPGAPGRVGGELGGAFVGGRGGSRALLSAGPLRDIVHLVGDLLVDAGRGGGQVPGPPVGVLLAFQLGGQRPVGGEAPGQGGVLVGGRSDQRVAEGQRVLGEPDEGGAFGRFQVLQHGARAGRCPQDETEVAGVVGGRHQQRGSRGVGQAADLLLEGLLDPVGG